MGSLISAASPVTAVSSLYWLSQLKTISAKIIFLLSQPPPGESTGGSGSTAATAVADAVHDLRVAVRRCQSTARALAPYLSDEWPRKIDKSLQPIRKACDRVRDLDVLLCWLQEQPAVHLATAGLLDALRRQHDQAYARLCTSLDSGGALKTAARMDASLQARLQPDQPKSPTPKNCSVDYTVADIAAPVLLAAAAKMTARASAYTSSDDPAARDQTLHQLRIAGKDFRYTLELLIPALEPEAAALRDWCCRLQDCLGEIHDTIRFASLLTKLERRAELSHELIAGLLSELSRRKESRLPQLAEMLQSMTPRWFAGAMVNVLPEGG
jgi:CHAD domain-containing protein